VAWNNLALTQSRRGLHAAAMEAARRAVARADAAEPQWVEPTRATLREVQAAARP